MKKEIAILGGSFDPITNAHLEIARKVRDTFDVDVLFLIAKSPRWKENVTDANDRLNMLKLALKGEERFYIDETELNSNNTINYTIDTVLELLEKYKGYVIYYIIGTDQLEKLHEWKNIEELSNLVQFVVIEREGHPINKENFELFDCIKLDIKTSNTSSTLIRNYESTDTKKEVLDYIYENGIYASNMLKKLVDDKRYNHSLNVANLAYKLAESNKFDPKLAYYAGLIHDCAKRIPYDKMVELMLKYEKENLDDQKNLYHQYLAPIIAKQYFNVNNKDIMHAIKYHTTGDYKMNTLDKIVYCADKLEEGREFDSSKIINMCMKDIDYGYAYEVVFNVDYIINVKKVKINIKTQKIYDECVKFIHDYKLNKIFERLSEKMAYNIKLYDCNSMNTIYQYCFVADALNNRQLKAIADEIEDLAIEFDFNYNHKEVNKDSNWVLIDLNDVIIQLFSNGARELYNMDEVLKDAKLIREEK